MEKRPTGQNPAWPSLGVFSVVPAFLTGGGLNSGRCLELEFAKREWDVVGFEHPLCQAPPTNQDNQCRANTLGSLTSFLIALL